MPAPFLEAELIDREQAGQFPGWRILNELRRAYEVSKSAMALRILELSNITAISLRIAIEGRGPRFPFDRSENSQLWLTNGVEFELERLWREARKSTRHSVSVRNGRVAIQIPCGGLVNSIKTKQGLLRYYWVIGWKTCSGRPEERRSKEKTQVAPEG